MRRGLFVLVFLLVLALPVTAGALQHKGRPGAGDGTLAIMGGRGEVDIEARGAVIGQVRRGVVRIKRGRGPAVVKRGQNIRIRIVDTRFRLQIIGIGVHLSAVGRGTVGLQGDPRADSSGFYSLNDGPFEPIPLDYTELELKSP